jgi:predicted O-methyltransferase YrrM
MLRLAASVSGTTYRRWRRPQFSDYAPGSASFYTTYEELLLTHPELWPEAVPPSLEVLEELRAEYDSLRRIVDERHRSRKLSHPEPFDVKSISSVLIYALVRLRKPETVVETGVANGMSSFFILHALRLNGRGKLYSIDVSPEVGVLLDDGERAVWGLRVLPQRFGAEDFRRAIQDLPPISMFLHDSDHSYFWQKMECQQASLRMASDGLVLSDDMDWSLGFIDYCREGSVKLAALIAPPTMFGVALPLRREPKGRASGERLAGASRP